MNRVLLLCVALAVGPSAAVAADSDEPKLRDLERPAAEIRAGERLEPDPERAQALYREYLELGTADVDRQTEAIRRLGDLGLDAADEARGEGLVPGAGSAQTRAAIDLYTRLLETQPQYPQTDAVLYQLARAWEAEGQPEKALARLDELVTRFPRSTHYGEAQFRRGEILFSAQRWREAEQAYAAVSSAGIAPEFQQQALYKQGWAQFKLSAVEASAESFLTLLDGLLVDAGAEDGTTARDSLSRADRELVDDSVRALSIQFAGLDAAASLNAALTAHGRVPYSWLLFSALGDMLVEKERFTDAADAYRSFSRSEPAHRRSPALQEKAIAAYLSGGFADLALEGKREFVDLYDFGTPFWEGRDREDAAEVVAALNQHFRDLARFHHGRAQATGDPGDYAQAAAWYRRYLQSFPDGQDAGATRFLLADALFEGADYAAAASEYERIAYRDVAGEQSAKAGYAALVAYDRQEPRLEGEARAAWHAASIASGQRFASTFPTHPQAGSVRLRTAQQLFNLGEFARAREAATLAAAHQPSLPPEELRSAWNVIADSAFELGDYAAAEEGYLAVLARLPADAATRPDLAERLAASLYKQGEAAQQAGDDEAAIGHFLRVGTLAPASPIRATATYDAAALLVRGKQWDRAIPVLESFRRDHPGHPLAASVPQSLALAYSEAGRPLEAAREFARIADSPSETDEVRRAALAEAASLYEQGGDRERAEAAWERFVERYQQPLDEANAVRLKLADMARARGDTAARRRWLQEMIAVDAAAGEQRSDSSKALAARAALELAEPARLAFESIALSAPLKRTLKAKRDAMEKALAAYQVASDYGVAEVTTAATFATAELYRRLAADLLASERPARLSPDELEQYDLLLEEQAYPFEERAIELHQANADRARDGVFDQSVQDSYAALAELKPARYARQESPVSYAAGVPDPSLARALTAASAGDWVAAEQGFRESLQAGNSAPALTGLALAHRHAGRFVQAEGAYRAALDADPGYGPALLNLAILLDLYLQRPAAALPLYEAYQATLPAPDERVTGWIREVQLRAGREATRAEGDT